MPWLRPNIGPAGRWLRAAFGLFLLALALAAVWLGWPWWVRLALAASGVFALFEAAAGWCAARACGIKTRF